MYFYRPQRSWGKVIFSEACVKNSVHSGGVCGRGVCIVGVCMVGWHAWWGVCMAGGVHGRGHACVAGEHAWWGKGMFGRWACVAGGMYGRGACIAGGMHGRGHAWQGCVPGRYYEIWSMSWWYTSYWNAYLFHKCFHWIHWIQWQKYLSLQ